MNYTLAYIDPSAMTYVIQAMAILVVIACSIGLAFIPAIIASKKGYSKVGFWFFGFFLFVIALIVSITLKDKKEFICNTETTDNNSNDFNSNYDKILKYKKLFDEGIITEEEFNNMKKELL